MRLTLLLLFIAFNAFSQSNQGLRFIQNKGQWNRDIDFAAQVPGGRVGVSSKGFSVQLVDLAQIEHHHLEGHSEISESTGQGSDESSNGHYFQINLLGSNVQSKAIVEGPLTGYYNYFLGGDTSRWATNALAFSSITYQEIYKGVDFRVSSVGNNLKYDFIVKAGADPSQIKIQYAGIDNIYKLNDDLHIETIVGVVNELKPFSYQLTDDHKKQTVSSEFRIDNNIVSFLLPDSYDESRTLIIDPLLIFSTYSGSTADNWGSTATPGEHGALYSAGVTRQDLGGFFPATLGAFQTANHGSFDMAIIKYDSAGTKFLYATHLGGAGNDSPQSLFVDKASGELIVLGISGSADFPVSTNAFDKTYNFGTTIFNRVLNTNDQWDITVTRLSQDGNQLVGSTFLGGSGNDGLNLPKQSGGALVVNYGDEMRGDVITDENGNVYISSVTSSNDFPIVNGFDNSFNGGITDGLVVKMSADLSSIVWSSYLGGSGFDAAYSIKIDKNENIILAGGTTSANFPTTSGTYQTSLKGIVDGWIARIAADGSSIMHSTLSGTQSFDQIYFIDLNSSGNIYCYGQTAGSVPISSGVYHNAKSGQFLQKFSVDLSTLEFSTVFGSASPSGLVIPNISPTAFLVNDCDNIYMAGWGGFVNSSAQTGFWQNDTNGMPVTADAFQKTTSGSDFYFMVLNGDATQLVYATFLGGTLSKTHVDGGTSRFDKYGVVYHAVCSGCSFGNAAGQASSDFPTTTNAKSRINRSLNCNNAAFKFDLSSLKANFETNNLKLTMPSFNNVCFPDSIVFQNISMGGKTLIWDFDDGTIVTKNETDVKTSVIHQYKQAGQYKVKLKITDLSTCSQTDSITKVINYFKPAISAGADANVCEGATYQLTASGGVTYNWTNDDGSFSSADQSPTVQPKRATAYYVSVTDGNGCFKKDTVNIAVILDVRAFIKTYNVDFSNSDYNNVCYPDSIRFKNVSVNGEEFSWDFGDGTDFNQLKNDTVSYFHKFQHPGSYQVKLKAVNENTCNKNDVAIKTINYYKDNIKVMGDVEICEGATTQLDASGGTIYTWSTEDDPFTSTKASVTVKPLSTTKYFVTVTDANQCMRKDTVTVKVLNSVALKWQHVIQGSCSERPSILVQNMTPSEEDITFLFDFGDGTTSKEDALEHRYNEDGLYELKLTAFNKFCASEETVPLPIYTVLVPNIITPNDSPGFNDNFEIGFGEDAIAPGDAGIKVQLTAVDRWGKIVFESANYQNNWNANDLAAGIYYVHVNVGNFVTCKNWLHIVK